MKYANATELITYTGFSTSDFKINGEEMSDAEWYDFLDIILSTATKIVNRYCNVYSFLTSTITEYHNGRGATGDNYTHRDFDKTFYLREGPVQSVTSFSANNNSPTVKIEWTPLTEITESSSGDYIVDTNYELAKIIILSGKIPIKGYNNVKIVYATGYDEDSDEYNDIKLSTIRVATNILLQKKKIQESTTVRHTGVRDFSTMFDLFNESYVLTDDIKAVLGRYRRRKVDPYLYQ